jgi:hypothetical protein
MSYFFRRVNYAKLGRMSMKQILAFLLTLGLLPVFSAFAEERHHHHGDKDKDERFEKKSSESKSVEKQERNHEEKTSRKSETDGQGEVKNSQRQDRGNRNRQVNQTQNEPAKVQDGNNQGRDRDRGNHHNRNRDNDSVQNNTFKNNSVQNDNNRGRDRDNRRDFSNNRREIKSQVRRETIIHKDLTRMGIKRVPEPIRDRKEILRVDRQRSVISMPKEGYGGKKLGNFTAAKSVNAVGIRTHMGGIVKNRVFINQINIYNRSENHPNRYYWHRHGGFDYCHYYDPWGYHWYGWYVGSNYFWTRYYSNRWWWYDSSYNRWCYWNNGGWWWQDPYRVNVIYVYNNNRYVPASDTNVYLSSAGQESAQVFRNSDQTRTVRVIGENRDAFLSDTSDYPSFKPVYLDSDVKDVKFSDGGQIMLTLRNGSFELFDSEGYPYKSSNDSASSQDYSSNQSDSVIRNSSQELPPIPNNNSSSSDKLPPIPKR